MIKAFKHPSIPAAWQEMTLIYLSGLNFATLDAFLMVLLAIFDRPCIADLNPLLP